MAKKMASRKTQFSNNLKLHRFMRGFTGPTIADVLGIPYPRYHHYETGRNEPSLSLLCKIADVLQVSLDDLVGHETKQSTSYASEYFVLIGALSGIIANSRKRMGLSEEQEDGETVRD